MTTNAERHGRAVYPGSRMQPGVVADGYGDFDTCRPYRHYGRLRKQEWQQDCAPLLEALTRYDAARLQLEKEGGDLQDLVRLNGILQQKFTLQSWEGKVSVSLVDFKSIKSTLEYIGAGLHLDVRRLITGMPSYYLCRKRYDHIAPYGVIVEDVYRSEGYPMPEERFVKLMDCGKEKYHLRLAVFREKLRERLVPEEGIPMEYRLDAALFTTGRQVFQAAWHEDQRPALQAAVHFELDLFQQAIELFYLALSGELCDLRRHIDDHLLDFFATVYPQPAIHAFLQQLRALDGEAINNIPKKALVQYSRLTRAFGIFLRVEVAWGNRKTAMPLYKLLFGNFSRLEKVGPMLKNDPELAPAISQLERQAARAIQAMVCP